MQTVDTYRIGKDIIYVFNNCIIFGISLIDEKNNEFDIYCESIKTDTQRQKIIAMKNYKVTNVKKQLLYVSNLGSLIDRIRSYNGGDQTAISLKNKIKSVMPMLNLVEK